MNLYVVLVLIPSMINLFPLPWRKRLLFGGYIKYLSGRSHSTKNRYVSMEWAIFPTRGVSTYKYAIV